MALRRQIRVGSQWMYADEAHKALREALRVMKDEEGDGEHGGHHQPWIRRYVFSTDHKWIGIQYGFTALLFLLLGFCLMILMRLQLGFPHTFSLIAPADYYQAVTMHGMIMVIYLLTALFLGGFGNYLSVRSALRIGLIPPGLPADKIRYVGNAAALGAQLALVSEGERARAEVIAGHIEHVSLAAHPDFETIFVDCMNFPRLPPLA